MKNFLHKKRLLWIAFLNFLTFPIRALTLFEDDKWIFSSLRSERFDYVASAVRGYCLDVGCGRYNAFVEDWLKGHGVGVDIYLHKGLSLHHILKDPRHFPFSDKTFETVTFIASLNHVQSSLRDQELKEAFRCLKSSGNIIVTMGHPLAEIIVHWLVAFYDRCFGTHYDIDHEKGMHEEEAYYLTDREIRRRLKKAGFKDIQKKYFVTQWGLNHMIIGRKRPDSAKSNKFAECKI